jgi:hypothetical protein
VHWNLRVAIALRLNVASLSHACRERLVELGTTDEQDYEEIVEEYEEEVFVLEEF